MIHLQQIPFAKQLLFFAALLLLGTTLKAQSQVQDSTSQKPRISIAIQPLFLFIGAAKFDFELQPAKHRFGYKLTTELYQMETKDTRNLDFLDKKPYDKLRGFGLGLQQKYKFREKASSSYVSYGFTYRNQTIAYETEGFYPFQENGLTYYEYGPIDKKVRLETILVNTTLGYQIISYNFMFDVYMGVGYKGPLTKVNFDGARRYDYSILSYAYEGFGVLAGIKFGFQLQ